MDILKKIGAALLFFAALPLAAINSVNFQEQSFGGSITYNEAAAPGDAVFARLSLKLSRGIAKKNGAETAAVLQFFKGEKQIDTAQFFTVPPKKRRSAHIEMLAGIPLSTWLDAGERYALKVLVSVSGVQSEAVALPFRLEAKTFVSERIPLDARNTGIRQNMGAERLSQIEKLNAILETVTAADVYALKAFSVPVASKRITATFGDRRVFEYTDKKTSTSLHYGIDYGVPKGTPVHACAEGKVALAENRISTGWSIVIEHLPGLYSLYYHLDSLSVKEGQSVKHGEKIGFSGATGLATGPHLHWEIRLNMGAVNPEFFLQDFIFQEL